MSTSIGMAVIGGGGGGMVASGRDGSMAAEVVSAAEEMAGGMEPTEVGGLVADEVPEVAMIFDTKLLRRRALLRRK